MRKQTALFLAFSFISTLLPASIDGPWKKAFIVELPKQQCLTTKDWVGHSLCITEAKVNGFTHTYLFEEREKGTSFEKRELLHFVDSSETCEGTQLNTAQFLKFEKRDIDKDGKLDGVVLIRAGKIKRKPTKAEPCPHPKIATAIYEISFLTRSNAPQLNPLSELVLGRLENQGALVTE